jgi:hypothetical protein
VVDCRASIPRSAFADLLASVVDAFLEWVQRPRSPGTYEWYRYRLERLVRKHPDLSAADVRPLHVQEWADGFNVTPLSQVVITSCSRCDNGTVRIDRFPRTRFFSRM